MEAVLMRRRERDVWMVVVRPRLADVVPRLRGHQRWRCFCENSWRGPRECCPWYETVNLGGMGYERSWEEGEIGVGKGEGLQRRLRSGQVCE
jgi:hypothetical protein